MFLVGEYVPWFIAPSTKGTNFELQGFGGRYVILCFFGSAAHPFSRRVLDDIERQGELFQREGIVFVGISADPRDANLRPGWKQGIYLCDAAREVSRLYGVFSQDGTQFQQQTIILDPMLRVASVLPFADDMESYVPRLLDALHARPALQNLSGHAPIIILSNVFEPEFCSTLIGLYEQHGGQDFGALANVDGKVVPFYDRQNKSRLDYLIRDPAIQKAAFFRMGRSLIPEVQRAFQFQAAGVESPVVACYDAATGGCFKAHRDNPDPVVAYRKFAVTITLNEDYEGGELWFPEYGSRLYRGVTGGAMVFSCTLLHEVKSVTKGRRFTYIPFLCVQKHVT